MCGIIGFLLNSLQRDNLQQEGVHNYLINSLIQLQNRGYDSAGTSIIENDLIKTIKFASTKNDNAINLLQKICPEILNTSSSHIGIGHTRWATHGAKTDINSHPHNSYYGNFSLVHNGIIENYEELKNELINNNFVLQSQTDTEVVVNLIEYYYLKEDEESYLNTYKSILKTVQRLIGTYGLVIICKNEVNKMYCIKNGSPLLVGYDENNYGLVASEQSGFCNLINTYITLENDDICIIEKENNKIKIQTNKEYTMRNITQNSFESTPLPFCHWTIKEIYDQPRSILNAYNQGGRIKNRSEIKLGGLDSNFDKLKDIQHIILLGMGTSYNAGLLGEDYFKRICNFTTVQTINAGEFTELNIPKFGKTAAILISQSGETKDLHECLKILKKNDVITIGVINVVDSLIAREVDCGVYCNGGQEKAVCSTKIFTSQVIILSLISIWFSQTQNIHQNIREEMIRDLQNLSLLVRHTLEDLNEKIKLLSNDFPYQNLFVLGKGIMNAIAQEGSLKIKEITYIHSEAYSSSALKHGPFALLQRDFPVFILDNNDEHHSKNMNTLEEVYSRDSPIYLFTNNNDYPKNKDFQVIQIPNNKHYQALLMIIPLQLFAYYLAINKNINCDYPRNLAKTVTTL